MTAADPTDFVAGDTLVYYRRFGPGVQLWATDGSSPGTRMLLQTDGEIGDMQASGDMLLVEKQDAGGASQLWRTLGTLETTAPIAGLQRMYPVAPMGGSILLSANGNRTTYSSAWISDGTAEGTHPLLTPPGAPNSDSRCGSMYPYQGGTVMGASIYFWANDGVHGCELWKSDGTAAGTSLVKDINPGTGDGVAFSSVYKVNAMIVMGGNLYFVARDSSATDALAQLWRTDGTEAGTERIADLEQSTAMTDAAVSASSAQLFFLGGDYGPVWRTDGTAAGTRMLADRQWLPGDLSVAGERAFFTSLTATGGALWTNDGTLAGTVQLLDLPYRPPGGRRGPDGKYYFALYTDGEYVPWISDGTPAGTRRITTIPGGASPFATIGGRVLYLGAGASAGLWSTDGTNAGTTFISGLHPGSYWGAASDHAGRIYFTTDDGLVSTDGTTAGSRLVMQGTFSVTDLEGPMDGDASRMFVFGHDSVSRVLWSTTAMGSARRVQPIDYAFFWLRVLPTGAIGYWMTGDSGMEPHFGAFADMPPPIAFTARDGVPLNTMTVSSPTPIQGLSGPTQATAENGQICVSSTNACTCNVASYSAQVMLSNGQYVCARHTASSAPYATTITRMTFDGGVSLFSSTTAAATRSTIEFLSDVKIGEEAGENQVLRIVRRGDASTQVTVSWNSRAGTALAGSDFGTAGSTIPPSGSITFLPGETQKLIEVGSTPVAGPFIRILPDAAVEADETFTVTLALFSTTTSIGSRGMATVTIRSAQPAVGFAKGSYSFREGSGYVAIPVKRYGNTETAADVAFTLVEGTAKYNVHYGGSSSGTIHWAAGDAQDRTILVYLYDDFVTNPDRYLTIRLSDNTVPIQLGETRVTIVDNEVPTVSFVEAIYPIAEDAALVRLQVQRTGPSASAISVGWVAANGSAIAGQDYGIKGSASLPAGVVSWPAGDITPRTITIPILADSAVEGTETFTVSLRTPSAGTTIGTAAITTVAIIDPVPESRIYVTPEKGLVVEGGAIEFTVNRDLLVSPTAPAVVTYSTLAGTARAGVDFNAKTGTLTWEGGDTEPRTVSIQTIADGVAEPPKSFKLTLSTSSVRVRLDTPAASAVILDEDEVFPANGAMPDEWKVPSGATQGWHVSNDAGAYEGVLSLRSDPIDDGESAQLEVTRTFGVGNVQFRAKVSSEPGFDVLRFFVDGVEKGSWSGTSVAGWQLFSAPITPGSHTLRWSYEKDGSASMGQDAAWIDAVVLP